MTLTVATAQFAPTEDKTENLELIESYVRDAAARGAGLVVLPEYAIFTAPVMDDRFVETAETLDGPAVTRVAELSDELGIAVILGINEQAGAGRIHNTLVAVQDGSVAAVYRKVHLYDAFGYVESDRVEAGAPLKPEVLNVGGFTVAMQTCYDLRFPEVSRSLVDAGAEILALPAEWVPGPLKEYHWNVLVRARAIENTVFVVAADQCAPTGAGNSVILDPMGNVLASIGEHAGLAIAQVDRARLDHVRRINPALSLRRYRVSPRGE